MKEEISYKALEKIGLTGSEAKVYLALLRLGTTPKGRLLKETRTAHSKIYEVINKLVDKGLCSTVIKNRVKHFSAAPPSRIKDYLSEKREEIAEEEKILGKMLPNLESLQQQTLKETHIEIFTGWKGMGTVYNRCLDNAKKGDEVFIMGAGVGNNEEKFELFFTKYGKIAFRKGIKIKVIFNKNARPYIAKIEKNLRRKYDKRFLFSFTPTELLIFKDITAITIRKKEPVIVLIRDRETADSFEKYFNELWKIAGK